MDFSDGMRFGLSMKAALVMPALGTVSYANAVGETLPGATVSGVLQPTAQLGYNFTTTSLPLGMDPDVNLGIIGFQGITNLGVGRTPVNSGKMDPRGKMTLATHYLADMAIPVGNFGQLPFSREGRPLQDSQIADATVFFDDHFQLGRSAPTLTYSRPSFTADARLFTDLLAYAPALNTSQADLLAVLDDEAAPDLRDTPGSIDAASRELIEKARSHGWQTLTLPNAGRFTFDGAGRYAYERRVSFGLQERVVCDGKTLLHIYPELGVAARRTVSRFHRAALADLVPWWLPPATDLARGCDLECVLPRTIALVPHGAKEWKQYLRYHLLFAEDGRLAERQLVLMPEKKVLAREIYDGKGGVRILDGKDKEINSYKRDLKSADQPNLAPETKDLVVLPLPYRSRSHSFPAADLEPRDLSDDVNGCFAYLDNDRVLSLLATLLAEQKPYEARLLVQTHFFDKGDLRPGLFAILAASGVELRHESAWQKLLAQKPDSALVRYLALAASHPYDYLLRRVPVNLTGAVAPADTFLGRLAIARELTTRWQEPPTRWIGSLNRRTDAARTLAFVHDNRDTVLGWAMLVQMQQRGGHRTQDYLGMAHAWEELSTPRTQVPPDFRAQYEQACCLADGDKQAEARKLFEELYARALKAGALPAIDSRFYDTMLGKAGADDRWTPLIRKTAAEFIKDKRRTAVVYLGWQCRQLNDPTLADTLLATALDVPPTFLSANAGKNAGGTSTDDAERLIVHLAAINYLSHISQTDRAGELMDGLLKNDKWNREPVLWRLAARVASQRGHGEVSVEYLERCSTWNTRTYRRSSTCRAGGRIMERSWRTIENWPALDFDHDAASGASPRHPERSDHPRRRPLASA